jgi:hypothetical protein
MNDIDKKGYFYLGKTLDPKNGKLTDAPLLIDSKQFNTHAVILGMTGSGKTGLGIDLLEEASLNSIPSIVIDPKGDLGNLLLSFPKQTSGDFAAWTEDGDAETIAKTWKEGLQKWGIDGARIEKFKDSIDINIYTPASQAGIPISILSTLQAPPKDIIQDPGLMRDLVLSTTTSLLGLVGVDADPVQSKDHILISTIIDQNWRDGKDLDLTSLIQMIQNPPFKKVGVIDLETFLSTKDRMNLSMKFNNLIAAPGFKAWLQGEKLDIQKLLYAGSKPRLSILSIAHLNDAERMFFVTMLLNQLLNWIRRQSGTSQLRALLYMDEIFGYFPPNSMPPSKMPMLTLLKQARAFGLGIVLSTQNPVDLDYKGLANCGLWFIGKLQTERDKLRVGDGLRDVVGGDNEELKKFFSLSNKRVFILKSIYENHLKLFETRWTMSYLFGPLTLPQIERLTKAEARPVVHDAPVASTSQKAVAPLGVPEYFWYQVGIKAIKPFQPFALCRAKVHFIDTKNKIDTWKNLDFIVPAKSDEDGLDWSKAQDAGELIPQLDKEKPENGNFTDLPAYLSSQKSYSAISKDFALWIYQTQELNLFYSPKLKLYSQFDESEEAFKQRLQDIQRANNVAAKETVRLKYQTRIATLQERLRKAQDRLSQRKQQVWRQWLETIMSVITTILGALVGRSRISKTTINQAGTSIRRAGRIQKEQSEASAANDSVEAIQAELNQVQAQMEQEMMATAAQVDIEKIKIPPRKSDISVETVGLVWVPI